MNKEIYFLFFIGCFDKRILLMPPAINVFDVESLFTQSNKLKKKSMYWRVLIILRREDMRSYLLLHIPSHTLLYERLSYHPLLQLPPARKKVMVLRNSTCTESKMQCRKPSYFNLWQNINLPVFLVIWLSSPFLQSFLVLFSHPS